MTPDVKVDPANRPGRSIGMGGVNSHSTLLLAIGEVLTLQTDYRANWRNTQAEGVMLLFNLRGS